MQGAKIVSMEEQSFDWLFFLARMKICLSGVGGGRERGGKRQRDRENHSNVIVKSDDCIFQSNVLLDFI